MKKRTITENKNSDDNQEILPNKKEIDEKNVEKNFSNKTKNQLKSTNQIQASPIKDMSSEPQKPKVEISSFQDLIDRQIKKKKLNLSMI